MINTSGTALLLVGLMRDLARNWNSLEKLSRQNDIFVATSGSGLKEAEVRQLKKICKSIVFVEEDARSLKKQAEALKMSGGNVLLQWQKLDIAFSSMIQFEEVSGQKYETVIKIRSDIKLSRINFNQFRGLPKNSLRGQTDVIFGGSRDSMLNFYGFFQIAQNRYYRNSSYQKIDWEIVAKWDALAAGQHRLLLPKSAFEARVQWRTLRILFKFTTGPGHGILRTNNLSRKLLSLSINSSAKELNSFSDGGDGLQVGVDDGNPLFPSERSYATHAAKCGLVLLQTKPFVTPFRLRHSRGRRLLTG